MTDIYAHQYLFVAVLAGAAIALGVAPLILATFIAPKKPGQTKQSAYECGLESTGEPWAQIRSQYYLYALCFVVFDVEIAFILPWALVWRQMGPMAVAEMGVFLGILGFGLAYAWKKGILEWDDGG